MAAAVGTCVCGAVEVTESGEPRAAGYCLPREMGGSGEILPE